MTNEIPSPLSLHYSFTSNNNNMLVPLASLFLGLFVLVAAIVMAMGSLNASTKLHLDLLANILHSPSSFFDTTPQGRILNRFSKDIEGIDSVIPRIITMCLMTFLGAVGTLIVLGISTPWILIIVPPLGVLYYLIQVLYV